jgi:tetratricopeptide (TPR) repeat protein
METSHERAWQLYRFRRYALALEETVKFLGQYPESAEAFCLAALIHGKEKRQKQAIEAAEAAIRYMPDWSYPHYVHALVAYWFNKYDVSLRSLSEALRIQPTDPDFYELVSAIYAEKGLLHTSLEMAEKGLEHHPEHVGCLFRRGTCLFDLNHKAEAEVAFRTILTIENEHAPSQGFVGYFEVQKSNYTSALPLLRNALRDNPEWKLAQTAWKESLRGQYPAYGFIASIRHWIFEKHIWRVFASCFVLFGLIVFLLRRPGVLGLLEVAPLVVILGSVLSCGLLLIIFGFTEIYLGLISRILLLTDRELRQSFNWRQKLRVDWPLLLFILWLVIVPVIVVLMNMF